MNDEVNKINLARANFSSTKRGAELETCSSIGKCDTTSMAQYEEKVLHWKRFFPRFRRNGNQISYIIPMEIKAKIAHKSGSLELVLSSAFTYTM